jgi:multidrug efflux system membrane fusion protein
MNTGAVWVLAAAAMTASCAKQEVYQKPPTPVRVQAVGRSASAAGVRYSASVEPRTRVDLAFKAGGYIQQLARIGDRTIQDGDHVTRGMVLARIGPADYEEKVKQARSQLAEAEAAQAQVKGAYDRATQLFQARSLARPEYEQAQAAYDTVQAKLAGARALVQEAENARTETALTSPINGLVLKRLVEIGSLVGPGTGGFVLADTSSVKVVFGAPDTMLKTLHVGSVQSVSSEAVADRRFSGRITKIAPAADPRSRVFDVEITVPNADGALKAGMVAVVQVLDASSTAPSSTLVVPLSAIVRAKGGDGYAVYVVEDKEGKSIARLRNVTLGTMIGNQIAVAEGIHPGERVVVSGATIIIDGDQVSLIL